MGRFTVSVVRMNGLRGRIQTLASTCRIPRNAQQFDARKVIQMGLFKPDLYRSFFFGFGLTAVTLAVKMMPHLI
jgi:hypothetical protein